MSIPIRNLYYLLSYAWKNDWGYEWSSLNADNCKDALDLTARMLVRSSEMLLRRGLDKGYREISEEIHGVRGRIDIANTIKRNGLYSLSLTCVYEELSESVLHNQIIKTTLSRLLETEGLEKKLRNDIYILVRRMEHIEEVELSNKIFSKVRIFSNIRQYRGPIHVCKLIYDQLLPNETSGGYKVIKLPDLTLSAIFERFTYNFYEKHLDKTVYSQIKRDRIQWQDTQYVGGIDDLLPVMNTDVSLFNTTHKLVIECKFYENALRGREYEEGLKSKDKFISNHLYQIFSYLKNLSMDEDYVLSGLLLYPENSIKINSTYILHGHKVCMRTLDLDKSHTQIHESMLEILYEFQRTSIN